MQGTTKFSDAVEKELELLYRTARRLTGNSTSAEDIVSQTLVKAYESWSSFDGRYLRSWLLTILKNEWLGEIRKRKVRKETTNEYELEQVDENFWKPIDSALESRFILQALEQVPDDFRIVITLCDIDELDYSEAAAILDVPIGTVKSRLFRGRKILRSLVVCQCDLPTQNPQ